MNTTQLKCAIREDACLNKLVKGVYSSDVIPSGNELYPYAYVINTDPQSQPGEHWLVCVCENDQTREFYDSFGRSPSYFNENISKKFKGFDFNDIQIQKEYNDTCGFHVLYFLIMKCRGKSLKNIVNSLKGLHDPDRFVYDRVIKYFSCDL